jgi:hypothetical protein
MTSYKTHLPDAKKVKDGIKMPLLNPDGSDSGDYLMVRWVWDDAVRAALDNLKREGHKRLVPIPPTMTGKARKDAEAKNKTISEELIMEGFVAQVAGWSFDEKPTKANLVDFLKARPDVADRVDTVASTSKYFFSNSGVSS